MKYTSDIPEMDSLLQQRYARHKRLVEDLRKLILSQEDVEDLNESALWTYVENCIEWKYFE